MQQAYTIFSSLLFFLFHTLSSIMLLLMKRPKNFILSAPLNSFFITTRKETKYKPHHHCTRPLHKAGFNFIFSFSFRIKDQETRKKKRPNKKAEAFQAFSLAFRNQSISCSQQCIPPLTLLLREHSN